MKFSLNFVKEFLDIKIQPPRLAELLTHIGMEVEHLEKEGNDWIFEIEVTSNRYDWLSILGISHEIACLLNKKLKVNYPKVIKKPLLKEKEIIIENLEDSPFYIGRLIKNVKIEESPAWLKSRVLNCGISSINNVVDITNYCMLKWGNPLHAFDADKIEGNIYIRRAKEKELFVGIDGKERFLTKDNLVIADDKKVIALAGVMGAKNTEVDQNTKNIFLEAAIFSPVVIRRSRQKVGLDTESSYRFERRVFVKNLEYASAEASQLIEKLCRGVVFGYKEAGKEPKERVKRIKLDLEKMSFYLGKNIPSLEVKKILSHLEFKVKKISSKKFLITVPEFRFDVKEEVDVYEEVSRFYGYDKIPSIVCPLFSSTKKDTLFEFKNDLRKFLALCGLREIITYSIESEEEMRKLKEENFIEILNPLRKQENVLRTNLALGMIKNIRYNLNHYQSKLRFFEIANVYFKEKDKFVEVPFLSLGVSGVMDDFFYLKAVVEEILNYLNLKNFEFKEESQKNFSNALKIVVENQTLGFLGKLDKNLKEYFDLKEDLIFAQLDVEILNKTKKEKIYQPFSLQPIIFRDISIALRKDRKFKEIKEIIEEVVGSFLQGLEIIDVYKGKDIPNNYCAFTLRVFYQDPQRTLTSQEVDSLHNQIRGRISQKEGVILR
jgi:phenylalanyl-tRNA synthetase beta chain